MPYQQKDAKEVPVPTANKSRLRAVSIQTERFLRKVELKTVPRYHSHTTPVGLKSNASGDRFAHEAVELWTPHFLDAAQFISPDRA